MYKEPIDTCSVRLHKALEYSGMKQVDLIEKTGIKKSAMSQYFSGKINPKSDKLYLLAKALNVSPVWLMGYDVPMKEEKNIDRKDGIAPYHPGRNIFVLGRISAGVPLFADEQVEGTVSVDLPEHGDYFALRVVGDSMDAAHIFDGSLVVVKLTKEVPNNCIAIVKVNGYDATVKRFRRDGNIVQLIPQSTNPEHAIQLYDIRKVDVEIIGRVVQTIMDVN